MTTPRDRGVCRVCRIRRRLDVDGRIESHEHPNTPGDECGGTGYLPAEEAAAK